MQNLKIYLSFLAISLAFLTGFLGWNYNKQKNKIIKNSPEVAGITSTNNTPNYYGIIPLQKKKIEIITPVKYEISGGTHAFQSFNNCGPASLSMALSFYDINVSQNKLGSELRPYQHPYGNNDDKSVTLYELAEKSKEYGFTPYYRPNGNVEMLKKYISNDIPVITRTILEPDSDIGHYRVIYGYNDNTQEIIQNDSLQGEAVQFSYNNFMGIWKHYNYEYLVLIPDGKEEIAAAILGEEVSEITAWQNTVNRLESEIAQNPNDYFLKFSSSVAYYNIGEYEKSIEAYEEVENKVPFRTIWYQIEPLLAYQKLKRYDDLLPRIDEIINNNNRAFSELYVMRGEIYLDQGKTEAAKAEFEKAVYYNLSFADKVPQI